MRTRSKTNIKSQEIRPTTGILSVSKKRKFETFRADYSDLDSTDDEQNPEKFDKASEYQHSDSSCSDNYSSCSDTSACSDKSFTTESSCSSNVSSDSIVSDSLNLGISLRTFGYSTSNHKLIRKHVLTKGVLRNGYLAVRHRLLILMRFNKENNVKLFNKYKHDVAFIDSVWGESSKSLKNIVTRKPTF